MIYPEDAELQDYAEKPENQRPIFDGTANLDYLDDNQVPQVKGLIELLNQYFIRSGQDH